MDQEEQVQPQPSTHPVENSEPETLASLSQRVNQLEQQLNNALLLLSDLYRYDKLRDLLAAQKWQEADLETTKVMLEIAGQSDHDNLTPDDVIKFPCSSLRLIDQLWCRYSDNQFGFSRQQQIYVDAGGTDDISNIDLKILESVGDHVGWRGNKKWLNYDQLDFSLSAPLGCHPSNWWRSAYGAKMAVYFLARLMQCEITSNQSIEETKNV